MIVHITTRTDGLDDGDVTMVWRFALNGWSLKVMMTALMQTGCAERWLERVAIVPPIHQLQTAISYALMLSEQWVDALADDDPLSDTEFPDFEVLRAHDCAKGHVEQSPMIFRSTSGTFFASLVSFNIQ